MSLREASALQGHEAPHVGQHAWAGLLDNEETDVIWSWVTLCSDVVGTPFKLRILRDMNYGYYTGRDRDVMWSWVTLYYDVGATSMLKILCYELCWRTDVIWSWIMLCFNVDTTLWNYVLSRAWGCEWKFFSGASILRHYHWLLSCVGKAKMLSVLEAVEEVRSLQAHIVKAGLRGTTATNVQY